MVAIDRDDRESCGVATILLGSGRSSNRGGRGHAARPDGAALSLLIRALTERRHPIGRATGATASVHREAWLRTVSPAWDLTRRHARATRRRLGPARRSRRCRGSDTGHRAEDPGEREN